MSERLPVWKTYKLFIGGAFPRTESGRTTVVHGSSGEVFAHLCRASRKDFRNAVVAARGAQAGWAKRTAYNRGQILYRLAEMLEGRASEFADALCATGEVARESAIAEVRCAADRLVTFAGWSDKYAQIVGCQNPVAGPFHNFSLPEASGVVVIAAPARAPLLALVSLLAPAICAGNSVVALGSELHPVTTAILGEVVATSDVPGGVVNLLTGQRDELLGQFASHRDVDGILAAELSDEEAKTLQLGAAENLKRVHVFGAEQDWVGDPRWDSPQLLEACTEIKTLWHPARA